MNAGRDSSEQIDVSRTSCVDATNKKRFAARRTGALDSNTRQVLRSSRRRAAGEPTIAIPNDTTVLVVVLKVRQQSPDLMVKNHQHARPTSWQSRTSSPRRF
jgi:hypothetical protein